VWTLNPQFKNKMELTQKNLSHVNYTTSLGARIGLNIVAKDIVLQHPLLGVGVGDYLSEKAKIIDKKYPERAYVRFLVHYHNQYAEFAVIAGILGLLAYIALFVALGRLKLQTDAAKTLQYLLLATFICTASS